MAMIRNTIRWFESAALDAPELKSPQPCPKGVYCDYRVMTRSGDLLPGCCRGVHPGEEGTGRQLFPARKFTDPKTGVERSQGACVRLIGNAGFYRRRQLKMTWPAWCAKQGINYVPNARVTVSPGAAKKPRLSPRPCSKCGHVDELSEEKPIDVSGVTVTVPDVASYEEDAEME